MSQNSMGYDAQAIDMELTRMSGELAKSIKQQDWKRVAMWRKKMGSLRLRRQEAQNLTLALGLDPLSRLGKRWHS